MLEEAIIKAKKYNVAMRAIKYNKKANKSEWSSNLSNLENDFKIHFTDEDKKKLLKKKEDLKKDLYEAKLHSVVIDQISNIFQFEKKKRKNDEVELSMPTKDAAEALNSCAELMGLLLKAYDISTSQIRRYLDSLRKIKANTTKDMFNGADVLLQQVKIAYSAGRDRDLVFLYDVLKPAIIEGSKGYEQFEQLLRFVESIIAYHKFYRGEN